ncbi:MAG: dipicolinate synthase subunit B [Oscillospiraceae bacterium]|nr:dipicolinate synthase subunit B [Oscillospiraceae bacterium]
MKKLGLALCGSFCSFDRVFDAARPLAERFALVPVMSEAAAFTDTRFGTAAENRARLAALAGRPALTTLTEVEPLGPSEPLDALLIAPCTGGTLAKLAHGHTDGPVTMAAKAHLRNGRPLLIALSTNDGLSGSAENIARLLNRKNVYFVPFRQDAPEKKPCSLQADFSLLLPAVEAALEGRQLQPLLLAPA